MRTALAILALSAHVRAGFLRFGCSQLVTERLDPLVNPGEYPSPHMHQIVGGNAFNVTMNEDIPSTATCTTCTFSEDFSNYWTAVLYFRASNGSFKRVPQVANQGVEAGIGGMTIYYMSPSDKTTVTAFKPGFRMLAGSAARRVKESGMVNLYRCYDAKFSPNPGGVATTDTADFPKRHCAGGIRVNTFFPDCWDGKTLDPPDHQSHVMYGPRGGGGGTSCPSTHPVAIPRIFIETVWNTGVFDKSMWPKDGSQPLFWAQGDGTGFGHHADYVFGWKGDSLQRAMNSGCSGPCPTLKTQSYSLANQCNLKQYHPEDLDGWIPSLPGNMMTT
ncbi:hypothetical protein GQ53DRAFT_863798 [Thozetella sp. PMI_491]|nr:hypothetical protein GQ53DRAFT_863798 [Thozetella sp. PMI_491]